MSKSPPDRTSKQSRWRRHSLIAAALSLAVLAAVAAWWAGGERPQAAPFEPPPLRVGSTETLESQILGEMIAQLLETDRYQAVRQFDYEGSQILAEALRAGEIDAYAEYTGIGLVVVLGEDAIADPQAAFTAVSAGFLDRFRGQWLRPWGADARYITVMRSDDVDSRQIEAVGDLTDHAGELTVGVDPVFRVRADGLEILETVYGLNFAGIEVMPPGELLDALKTHGIDVALVRATQPGLLTEDFARLNEDQGEFGAELIAPIVRGSVLDEHPGIRNTLETMSERLTERRLRDLNERAGVGDPVDKVVTDFLKEEGLAD